MKIVDTSDLSVRISLDGRLVKLFTQENDHTHSSITKKGIQLVEIIMRIMRKC